MRRSGTSKENAPASRIFSSFKIMIEVKQAPESSCGNPPMPSMRCSQGMWESTKRFWYNSMSQQMTSTAATSYVYTVPLCRRSTSGIPAVRRCCSVLLASTQGGSIFAPLSQEVLVGVAGHEEFQLLDAALLQATVLLHLRLILLVGRGDQLVDRLGRAKVLVKHWALWQGLDILCGQSSAIAASTVR